MPAAAAATDHRAATARGRTTQDALLDAAEQLFLAHGVDNVSLTQIRRAAGQRNASVVHFHFGDREGLLRALSQRHMPRLAQRHHELHEQMRAAGRHDSRALVEVMVGPMIDDLEGGPSARAWVVIAAELAARPDRRLRDFSEGAPVHGLAAATELLDRMAATMPRRRAVERLMTTLLATLHLCADRARHLAAGPASSADWRTTSHDEFRANLIDMCLGALLAPATAPEPPQPRSTHA